MTLSFPLLTRAEQILCSLKAMKLSIAGAESCTGGLALAALTAHAGASAVVLGGFVTYNDTLKCSLLDINETILARHGAVSPEIACAMVRGVQAALPAAHLAFSITGIAGPGGGSMSKPIGLVWIALTYRCQLGSQAEPTVHRLHLRGSRAAIREAAVLTLFDFIDRELQ